MKVVAVTGNSMWPALKDGDLVVIETGRTPQAGDLVHFTHAGLATVHRWLAPGLCKGDHEFQADVLPPDQIFEIVTGVFPRRKIKGGGRVMISPSGAHALTRLGRDIQTALSKRQAAADIRFWRWCYRGLLIVNGSLLRLFLYIHRGAKNHVVPDRL